MTHVDVFRSPSTVVVADGARNTVGAHAAAFGTSALVVTDARFAGTDGFADIIASLDAHQISHRVFSDTLPELPSTQVAEASELAATSDVVIAIGGGSCIDLAKASAVVAAHGGDISDFYGENRVPGMILPVIAVPTTAGTGSEVTPVAVISDVASGVKKGVSSPHLIPRTALVDPIFTHSCPPGLTASVGADTLCHVVESFTAVHRSDGPDIVLERVFVGSGAFTDMYGRTALRLVNAYLERAVANGDDAEARTGMSRAATLGGLALGTAGTAVAHAMQYPIGALTHTPHGVGVGLLLPYVMSFNRDHALTAFADLGDELGAARSQSLEQRADHAIARVTEILRAIGIPATLAEIGMTENDIPDAAAAAMTSARLIDNNPRPLQQEDVERLFTAALTGDLSIR